MFVGIMWSRFGTPTSRASSGTQEEFERAVDRHEATLGDVSVLFYFKDAPIAPSKIDTSQIAQVQEFKKSTQSRGLLTWDFVDIDQFEKLINLHITRHVQEWRKGKEGAARPNGLAQPPTTISTAIDELTPPSATEAADESADESGYLDLLEDFNEWSARMGEIAIRITSAQQALSEQTDHGRKDLEAMQADPNLSAKKVRTSIARVADEMLRFTERVQTEIPEFRAAVDASMNALTRLATLVAEIYPEQMQTTKAAAIQLLATLINARQATEGFKQSTVSMPRMTKELNVAKRKQASALDLLIAEFENGERLLTEGLAVIAGLTSADSAE